MSGVLVLVATPLGNLGDLSPRALSTLLEASVVYCEDTRRTRTLFAANGVKTPHLVALHDHNEQDMCAEVSARVLSGETVALVSDAGTPGISDPGERVVAAVVAAGGRVSVVPGPAAVIGALVVSGLPTERFVMDGFVPRKASERRTLFDQWDREARTIVFYESPQRVGATLTEMAERWPERTVAVVRELTKVHEEVVRGTLERVASELSSSDVLGEITCVLEGREEIVVISDEDIVSRVSELLDAGLSVRDAAATVASELGVAHRRAYDAALAQRAERAD